MAAPEALAPVAVMAAVAVAVDTAPSLPSAERSGRCRAPFREATAVPVETAFGVAMEAPAA
jgi:hypothetical protein